MPRLIFRRNFWERGLLSLSKIRADDIRKEYEDVEKDKLLDEVVDLVLENEKLKRKLRKYENPHTPPSKEERKTHISNFVSLTGLPVGKKTGYCGATREKKAPTYFVACFDNVCKVCHKHNKLKETKTKIYEEVPDPQPLKIVEAKWGHYECSCGNIWESIPQEVPNKGLFGKNLQSEVTLLRFDDRLPLRKVVNALERRYETTFSSKAIYDITKRVADKITPEYEEIKRKIRRTTNLNIDETKIKVQGKTYWLWVFRSNKNVFFMIHEKRNRSVLDEILGYFYRGVIICDGLSAYEEYTKYLQRCWAHILRETKELAEKFDDAKPLHNWMKDLFENVKSVNLKWSIPKREKLYKKCFAEMEKLIQIYSSYGHLAEVVTTIKNGLDFWFTRILHPQIEPTNNRGEQSLREIVVIKKIIGTLRNEDGANILSKLMTLISTWRLNGINPFYALRSLL